MPDRRHSGCAVPLGSRGRIGLPTKTEELSTLNSKPQKGRDYIPFAQRWACGEHSIRMGQNAGVSEPVSKCTFLPLRVFQHSWLGCPHGARSETAPRWCVYPREEPHAGRCVEKTCGPKKPLEYFFRSVFNSLLGADTWVRRMEKGL